MKLFKRIMCVLFYGHDYVPYVNRPKMYQRVLVLKCTHCGKEIEMSA